MLTGRNDFDRMFGAMDIFRSRMNNLFSDFDTTYRTVPYYLVGNDWPRTNLYDAGEALELIAEVPGMGKDDINLKIQGNYLEINGTRKAETPEGYTVHKAERGTASFSRSFTLPTDIDANKVEATIKNGILTLKMPKAEAAKPKQINVKLSPIQ